jgi:hypothetical protein
MQGPRDQEHHSLLSQISDCEVSVEALENDRAVVYLLDDRFRLVYCNKAWDEFAEANGAPNLARAHILGDSVLRYLKGPLLDFYLSLYRGVLSAGQGRRHSFECSSSHVFRLFHMQVLPLRSSSMLLVVNSLRQEHAHNRPAFDPVLDLYQNHGIVTLCSHCRRARRYREPDHWDWVPDFIRPSTAPENISHGLCEVCLQYHYPSLVDALD